MTHVSAEVKRVGHIVHLFGPARSPDASSSDRAFHDLSTLQLLQAQDLFLFGVVLFLSDHALLLQLGQLLKLSHVRWLGRSGCLDWRNWRGWGGGCGCGWGCCCGGGRLLVGLLRPFFRCMARDPSHHNGCRYQTRSSSSHDDILRRYFLDVRSTR
jgi:hypothetical protein